MSEIFVTSDTHFNHSGMLQNGREAFSSVSEMDEVLIDGINATVGRKDTLYHLGDFCWQASRAGHYRQRINVRHLLVTQGNHDAASLRKHVSQMELMLFPKIRGRNFHLSHYPLLSWRKREHGGIHLYGHSHGKFEDQLNELWPDRMAMDVSVDHIHRLTGEWRPIHIEAILEYLEMRL
ncbi:hypothetical protein LCGC14_2213400 [marine sediment metagenome]|uniref:Calcineurin-like phosphoesterase domain-containing protein n=1 Tax=marine sediment metagenome TaxID=412755 RepID=A0A0F9DD89_9ZZZZ